MQTQWTAFTLRIEPGRLSDYQKAHERVWPQLEDEFRSAGIEMLMILQFGAAVVAVSKTSRSTAWEEVWSSEVHQRWMTALKGVLAPDPQGRPDKRKVEFLYVFDRGTAEDDSLNVEVLPEGEAQEGHRQSD